MSLHGNDALPSDRLTSPLIVSLLSPGGEYAWDEFVQGCADATFFHLSGWKRVIEEVFGHKTYYLQAQRAGAISGVLPLTHIKSALFGNSIISNAFCVYGGPATNDSKSQATLQREAVTLMERLGATSLEFRTRKCGHDGWACKNDLYVTFRKNLLPNAEDNLKAIPRKQRAMVRKGIQKGLRSEVDDGVDRLHRVYSESVRNLGTPVYPRRYFRLLKETFGNACDIVTIVHGREPVASVLNFYFRDEVMPYYGGGRAIARRLAGNDFLYWEVMRRASARGYRVFDFGRSKVATGAYAFKKNWGFEPTALSYQFKLAPGHKIPEVNPFNPKYRIFVELWKHLPLSVAGIIGPPIARDLG
jgi:FemAB-related protein (PEP-CTERM system-associated)